MKAPGNRSGKRSRDGTAISSASGSPTILVPADCRDVDAFGVSAVTGGLGEKFLVDVVEERIRHTSVRQNFKEKVHVVDRKIK